MASLTSNQCMCAPTWGEPMQRMLPGTVLTAATYVDKLLPIVLDADPWLLDHIQVGAGNSQRRVPAVENQETPD